MAVLSTGEQDALKNSAAAITPAAVASVLKRDGDVVFMAFIVFSSHFIFY